jgi:hypothetical protein
MAEEQKPLWREILVPVLVAAITGVGSTIVTSIKGSGVPHFSTWEAFGTGLTVAIAVFLVVYAVMRAGRQEIALTNVYGSLSRDPKTVFPLKCYGEFINSKKSAISVRVLRYEPKKVPSIQHVSDVLQVRDQNSSWLPVDRSLEEISVPSRGRFRAWVPIDSRISSPTMIENLRHSIGTLVLIVDNKQIRFDL